MADLLKVTALNAFYGGSHVIHDAAISVGAGESVALLGRNGAGKSTLLKSIVNAEPEVRGDVWFEGHQLGQMALERRSRLGMMLVPEDRRIYPQITVEENIALGAYSCAAGRSPLTLSDIWRMFPLLEPLRQRMGAQLSGGQQQLVAVARGVFGRPKLLLLDEPVEGLAPLVIEEMGDHIAKLGELGDLSIVVAEQNLSFARKCTSRIYLIDSGQIVFEGTWEEFDAQSSIRDKHLSV